MVSPPNSNFHLRLQMKRRHWRNSLSIRFNGRATAWALCGCLNVSGAHAHTGLHPCLCKHDGTVTRYTPIVHLPGPRLPPILCKCHYSTIDLNSICWNDLGDNTNDTRFWKRQQCVTYCTNSSKNRPLFVTNNGSKFSALSAKQQQLTLYHWQINSREGLPRNAITSKRFHH